MITLTTSKAVPIVLGGSATVNYDKLVVTSIGYDTISKTISGNCKVVCTLDAAQTPYLGTYTIFPQASPATISISIPSFPFNRTVNLTAGQITAVLGWFDTVQAQIEGGFITVGEVAGTQSTGV
jgi:hypothetical protein